MALSRKQKKELKKLAEHATKVWGEQRQVLDHAGKVLGGYRDAGVKVANQQVLPTVKKTVDSNVRPVVSQGLTVGTTYATKAKDKLVHDVYPAFTSALSDSDIANDPRVQKAVKDAKAQGLKVAKKYGYAPTPKKSGPGAGGIALIVLGVAALGGLVFAAVQTLRADDELWVADDDADTKA